MVTIIFTIHDDRSDNGFREIKHTEPSLELCIDYMHKYHNRSSSWYRWIEGHKKYAARDEIGVIR